MTSRPATSPITNPTSFGTMWRTRLASRLALSFLVPALAMAGVASGVTIVQARAALRESAYERLRAAAAVREAQLARWVDEQASTLRFLATLPEVRAGAISLAEGRQDAAADTLGALLHRSVLSQGGYARLAVLAARTGKVTTSSDSSIIGDHRVSERYFAEGRDSLVIQHVYPSPSTGRPTLTIAYPIRDGAGRTVAVLAGDANLKRIEEVIADRAGLGTTGEAYLIDRYHEFVSGARYGHGAYPRGVHTSTIDYAVRGASGAGIYRNYAGTEVIGIYQWLPKQQLALFAEMHTDEAFAPARRLAWAILGSGLLAALALGLGITFVARQIARPVLAIADAAQAVAGGDLNATAPVRTRDEIGRLAVAFNVMTARLRALYGGLEAQVRATEEAARATEEGRRLLRAVIDHLPALVAVKDLEGRYVVVNAGFSTLNGAAPEEMLGRHTRDVMSGPRAEQVMEADAVALSGTSTLAREETVTLDGEERTFLASRFPLLDDQGRVYALGAVATDITEIKRLQMQLLHQQKLEAVGRLAGGVAHDMNNLLTAVRCNAELLLDGMAPDDPDRVHLEEIDRSVRNGSALTRQLLTFSRAHVVRSSALDVNRILGGMAAMLRRYVGAGIDMQFVLADDLWLVHADEGQMEQVLLNLLSNAHDAMPAGGTATVSTSNVVVGGSGASVANLVPGDYVRLSVRDTGTGIGNELIPLLFEPFFTTKSPGSGTGLGLSTAYAIVQQAHGAITVDTELGAGTTFSVYLPRHADETVATAPVTEPARAPAPANGDTLLVVDDEPSVRTSLRRMLVRQGYRIIEAESGHDALEQFALHRDSIALVLTDVFMPGMSGHQLAAALRAAAPDLPIVFTSGFTADEVVRRGLMESRTPFLPKPFERLALVAMLETLLTRRAEAPTTA
jgi:PAS domain S-box-containing protein